MQPGPRETKSQLRSLVKGTLRNLTPEYRAGASVNATQLLVQQPRWQAAQRILFYAPLPEELDIWQLIPEAISQGKSVALPRFEPEENNYVACLIAHPETEVVRGQFGIREAAPSCPELDLNRLDLILVPGVAFDLQGRRLGRGRGFYDRLLEDLHGTTCGVCFDEQMIPEVPVEPHDVCLNCILTPTRWLEL